MASLIQEYPNTGSCRGRGSGDTVWSAPFEVMQCEMVREIKSPPFRGGEATCKRRKTVTGW